MATTIETGQVWEMYSSREKRWLRVIVARIEYDRAILRYEGSLEFVTADVEDMRNRPELFRPAATADP